MANVLNRLTKEYLTSVSTGMYPTSDWIINPNLSAVTSVPSRYWKITGDAVSEMSAQEKAVVDYPNLSGLIVLYDHQDSIVADRITMVIPNTLLINFDGVAGALQDPVLPNNVMFKYMKVSNGSLAEMVKAEKDAIGAYVPVERSRTLIMHDIYVNASGLEQMARLMASIDPRTSFIIALDAYNYPLSRDIMIDMYVKDPDLLVEDLLHVNKYIPQSILTI